MVRTIPPKQPNNSQTNNQSIPIPRGRLTIKQARFVQEYLIDGNGLQAAIRAGYSKESAGVIANENLNKPYLQQAIAEAEAHHLAAAKITKQRILAEYAKLAFVDPRKFYDEDGRLLPIPELDADTAAALQGFEAKEEFDQDGRWEGVLKKIKSCDKKAALDSLAKCAGMFIDKHELTGKDGAPLSFKVTVDD